MKPMAGAGRRAEGEQPVGARSDRLRAFVSAHTGPTARRSVLALCDQGLLSAANFLTAILLARVCSREELGAYALAFAVMLAANGFQTALITGPLTVLGAQCGEREWPRYATSMAAAQVGLGLFLVLLALAATGCLKVVGTGAPLRNAFLGMVLALFFVQTQEFCRRALYARLQAGWVLISDAAASGLQVLGVLFLWKLGGGTWITAGRGPAVGFLSPRNAFLCLAAGALAGSMIGGFKISGHLVRGRTAAWEHYRMSWRYARWSLGSFAGSVLTTQASIVVVGSLGGAGAAGPVEAARLLVAPIQLFNTGASSVLAPRAAQAYGHGAVAGLRSLLRRLLPTWGALICGYAILVASAPGAGLRLLYGGKYADADTIVVLWVAAYLLVAARSPCGLALAAMRRPEVEALVAVPMGVVTVMSTAFFMRHAGETWAVAGQVVGGVLWLAVLAVVTRKTLIEARGR